MAHHPNHPQHHQHDHEHEKEKKEMRLHKDWRTWVVVLLMLAGMFMYVATLDESEGPGGEIQPAMGDAAE
jgi:Co/Zn/Cd efflux system component